MPAVLPDHLRRSSAQRAKDWRLQRIRFGQSITRGKSGKSGKKPSLFDSGEFVAIDGEGFSEGEEITFTIGDEKSVYKAKPHYYAYLSASDGSEIYSKEGRLSAEDCLNFLIDIRLNNSKAIVVCFGGSYDVCQMLAYDLSREQILELLRENKEGEGSADRKYLDITLGDFDYRLEYRPRKSFTVLRWNKGESKYQYKGNKQEYTKHVQVTVWDTWGFFQDNFVGVIEKWIPDSEDYAFIKKMKAERSVFARHEISEIRRYNMAELRCLVQVMNKVREAVKGLGLTLSRWDGAGAIAGAMNKLHKVKDYKKESPALVFEAARHAYSGGHIEVCQMGHYIGKVYHYDVNSAYPSEFAELPSLQHGVWIHGKDKPPPGFTLVKVRWQFFEGNNFYPLFYREESGSIVYPSNGEGWYWFPEYDAACVYAETFGFVKFEILEYWHFKQSQNVKPFSWVRDYYNRRQSLVAESKKTGIANGEEKIIKLGLNSLYGKTAQQVGARKTVKGWQLPSYFQLEWAGAVTAGCRAKLMIAAIQNASAVISFATDGLFTTQPLDLFCPKEKILGAWEYQEHDGITIVMPGVYWLHDNNKMAHYSRGFDKEFMKQCDFVLDAWKKKHRAIPVKLTRLIGLGTAAGSETLWNMRGMFAETTRKLALNGENSKRYPIALSQKNPHKTLVFTEPKARASNHLFGDDYISAPYPIGWIDTEYKSDEMEEEREAMDAELA